MTEPRTQQQSLEARVAPYLKAIEDRTAVIGIIGLGYVGLPLLLEFYKTGFATVGLDLDQEKIDALKEGRSYILHIAGERTKALAESGRYKGSANMAAAAECDALILCVPTPLTHHREPDISYVRDTCISIAPYLRPGQLICLESTTYPGTTEEVMIPALEAGSGLKAGRDFFVAYSPEREDPSNANFGTKSIPKVVGGWESSSLEVATALYNTVICKTVPVSSCAVAEATKLVENIFRSVNIAMVNEMKVLFDRMGIDIWEVIDAAKTKPFGFMPFYPGPGLGGHCIPIDPFYLTWKAREFEMQTKFIELSGEINSAMPDYVVTKVADAFNDAGRSIKGSRILLVGLAYKANVDDLRESPSLKLIRLLEAKGAKVVYHDPHIPAVKPTREYPELTGRVSVPLEEAAKCDLTLIATAHAVVDYQKLADLASIIVDTRNAMRGINGRAKVYKS